MATYVPPKRATELIFYLSLPSQAGTVFQVDPTLAAGDVKVSKDGGALANITTLPTVTPAGGKLVKVTLSATEMTADNLLVVFSDVAGAEWVDATVGIATAARQIDDIPTAVQVADALLARDLGSGTGAGTLDERTVRAALRALRNKWGVSGGTLSVYEEDDTTVAWTAAAVQTPGDPVSSLDPA